MNSEEELSEGGQQERPQTGVVLRAQKRAESKTMYKTGLENEKDFIWAKALNVWHEGNSRYVEKNWFLNYSQERFKELLLSGYNTAKLKMLKIYKIF